jgi:hypothetical protein
MFTGNAPAQVEDGDDQPDRQDDGNAANHQDDEDSDSFQNGLRARLAASGR